MDNPTIALVQIKSSAARRDNLGHAIGLIQQAASQGAHIVCLSELFKNHYFCQENRSEFFELAEPIPGPTSTRLAELSRELRLYLVASLYEREDAHLYNTALILSDRGEIALKYRKVHIPDDLNNHYSEKYYFKRGNLGYPVCATPWGKLGVAVCWDQWFPEPARAMALQGAQLIFYPTAIGWPRAERHQEIGRAELDAWQTIQRAHAIANGCFVAVCNRVGSEDHINFWGNSFIADPLGRSLSIASNDDEEILINSIEMNRLLDVRKDWPFIDYLKSPGE